jgi:two-component system response regulator DesR
MAQPIRIVLAEDQAMVAGALKALLESEPDLSVVAVAADGAAALREIERLHPTVLVTDIEMPKMSGLELAQVLRERKIGTRVIIVTTFARPGYLRRALDAGVQGYLLKARPATELAEAIRRVVRGLRVVDPELAAEAWSEPDPLTDRERQILARAAQGESSADIAQALALSEGTVRNYLSEAIQKIGAANRIEAARVAREKGWL